MLRTMLRAALVAALLATLVLPATPAAAATTPSYTLHSKAVTVARGYQMTIAATQDAELQDSVSITLSKVSDPAGVGKATQSHTWNWQLNSAERFKPGVGLATATLNTGTELAGFGKVVLTFNDDGPARGSLCDGGITSAVGALTGTVTFDTGTTVFGTITNVPVRGTLTKSTNMECLPDGSNANDCPTNTPALSVTAFKFGAATSILSASKGATGAANIMMMRSLSLPEPTAGAAPGSKTEFVSASVPRGNVVISSTLGSATITGDVPLTWITGESTFAKTGVLSDPYTSPCGTEHEVVSKSRSGVINGTLAAPLVTGGKIAMGKDAGASAGSQAVRAK